MNERMMAEFIAKHGSKKASDKIEAISRFREKKPSRDVILFKLDQAARLLAEAETAEDTIKIMDLASAQEHYAKRRKLSEDAITSAKALRRRAMRKLGQALKATPKAKGHRFGGAKFAPPVSTLAERGIDKRLSAESQRIADKTDEEILEMAKPKPERRGGPRTKKTKHCPTCTCSVDSEWE